MLHRRLANRCKEVRHLCWVGIPPFKPQHFWIQRSKKALTDLHCQVPVLPLHLLPSSPCVRGGAQSRCTRTDSAERVSLNRAMFLDVPWVLVGACLGCAAQGESSVLALLLLALLVLVLSSCVAADCLRGEGKGAFDTPSKQNPFGAFSPSASAGAWNWFVRGAVYWPKGWTCRIHRGLKRLKGLHWLVKSLFDRV